METFKTTVGFCPICGTILPNMSPNSDKITCYNCKKQFNSDVLGNEKVKFKIHFNTYDPEKIQSALKPEDEVADGPVVDRKCPKCGNRKMSYATIQLRSADEGQTVFFTCLKCKYKESENS